MWCQVNSNFLEVPGVLERVPEMERPVGMTGFGTQYPKIRHHGIWERVEGGAGSSLVSPPFFPEAGYKTLCDRCTAGTHKKGISKSLCATEKKVNKQILLRSRLLPLNHTLFPIMYFHNSPFSSYLAQKSMYLNVSLGVCFFIKAPMSCKIILNFMLFSCFLLL